MIIFSKIKYYVIILDRDIFFWCVIFCFFMCEKGLVLVIINILICGEMLINEIDEGIF